MPVQLIRKLTITVLASVALAACANDEASNPPDPIEARQEVPVEIGIDERGCPIAPDDVDIKGGNRLIVSLKADANRAKVAAWSIGFTEGSVNKFGCTILRPGAPTAVNIPNTDNDERRVCYTIVTKLAAPDGDLGYCELDPTIFVNRDQQYSRLTSCAHSNPTLKATPPRLTCGKALEPGDWPPGS